jgi:hypothetical protein
MMQTTEHEVDLRYTEAELRALFQRARAEDVERGGRYDGRAGAINIWSHAWINDATRAESETIGSFYFRWAHKNQLYLIACDEGFSCHDLLYELAILEEKALGYVKHGREGSAHAP